MMSKEGVCIHEVSHGYEPGKTVVDQVCLEVQPGEVHCLLGPSGSGKTTLLRLVAGLERARSGTIWIAGEIVESSDRHVPPEGRRIGYVFQDYALFPHLSILRNVMYGMKEGDSAQRRASAMELLSRVGLEGYAKSMPHMLSGGQQQRVALVRALARQPVVMLLDESFSSLDTALREKVREETLVLLREARVATLMVTHDPYEAYVSADRISVMSQGKISSQGTPLDVCEIITSSHGLGFVRVK